jgi:hypothetical protein
LTLLCCGHTYAQHKPKHNPQAPRADLDATGIGIDVLSGTPNGRQTTFETRMAMQRELDEARTQLKNSVSVLLCCHCFAMLLAAD